MVSYLVLRLRFESGFGSTIQETLAWDGASWSESGGSSCQTRRERAGQDSEWALTPSEAAEGQAAPGTGLRCSQGTVQQRNLAPLEFCSEPWYWSWWQKGRKCSALGSLWWAEELSPRRDHSTHPRPMQRTQDTDKGQDTWRASPGRESVSHRESMRPRCETAHRHFREPDTQDSERRKDLDSRTKRRQR